MLLSGIWLFLVKLLLVLWCQFLCNCRHLFVVTLGILQGLLALVMFRLCTLHYRVHILLLVHMMLECRI